MQLIALVMGLLVPALAQPADKIARDAIQSANVGGYGNSYQANPSVELGATDSRATPTQVSHPGPSAVAAGQQGQQNNIPDSVGHQIDQNTLDVRVVAELVFTGNATRIAPYVEKVAKLQQQFEAENPSHRKSVQEAAAASAKTAQDASQPSATPNTDRQALQNKQYTNTNENGGANTSQDERTPSQSQKPSTSNPVEYP